MAKRASRQYPKLFSLLLILFTFVFALVNPKSLVFSATADHIVISEVQRSGATANDEFVELYNPTGASVDISSWKLTRMNSSGTEGNLVSSIPDGAVIAAHSFYLLAHEDYDGAVTPDKVFSNNSNPIGTGSTVLLYTDEDVLVDKVGFGTELSPPFAPEGAPAANPPTDGSSERKATSTSTNDSMTVGGNDEVKGNGEDTDDNAIDFISRAVSQPQNSASPVENPVGSVTPTGSPTPTPDPSITTTLSPSPTPTPTPTATPTSAHVVISEVQRAGATADDEFVELYNPTSIEVNIGDWKLTRINSTGTESNLVSSFPDGSVITAYGYFLVAHEDYMGSVDLDQTYTNNSNPIGTGSTVVLYDDTDTPVDKVGFGTEATPPTSPEGDPATNPPIDGSIERKAQSGSTEESMGPGGADENNGNGEDTDNNVADFIERSTSQPQNSNSTSENLGGVAPPTPTSSPSPTVTQSPTMSITPTATPSNTPSPTNTIAPTQSPSPTIVMTPTPTPPSTPIVFRWPIAFFRFPFPGRSMMCYLEYTFNYFRWPIPKLQCVRV